MTGPLRSATSDPVGRSRTSPAHGSYRSKTWCSSPVPRVSVRNSVRKPISARAGHQELQPHPAGAVVDHLLHAALAHAEQLGDDAEIVLRHVDGEPLDGLVQLAVDLPGDDLRLADGQLEALAAHHLDEDRQLQLTAALHLPGVGTLGRLDPQRDVADQLLLEPVLHQPGGELLAGLAGERGGVDADRHRDRRVVDVDDRQRLRIVDVGQRLADGDLGDSGDGRDVTGVAPTRSGTRSRAWATSSSEILARSIVPSTRHHATCWPRRSSPPTTRTSARRPR